MSNSAPSSDKAVLGTAYALLVGAVCLLLDLWVAAGVASLGATGEWTSLSLSPVALVPPLLHEGPNALAGASPVLFWAVVGVLAAVEIVVAVVAAMWITGKLAGRHDPSRLAGRRDLGDLAGKKAAAKARGLRASLAGVTDLGRDLGIRLMQITSVDVYMSWEDVALVIMGPRSNKTSAIAVPTILSATGPVVATSNKADIWALTASLRAQVGPVWVFDPQLITYTEQSWYVDPVRWIRDEKPDRRLESAARFIEHFTGGIKGERADPFFSNAGERVATGALLAAAATPAGTLREVMTYLAEGRRDAIKALDAAGAHEDAEQLEKTINGADVTAEGIYETARTALKSLRSEALMRWVTPPRTWQTPPRAGSRIVEFDPWTIVADAEAPPTVYLLSKESGSTSAPVVTALVDRITDVAERAAQARGGRLDPSLVLMLDEAANICPLSALPAQYSHWGSRGINAVTILQSYKQGARVWGREGMDSLWSAATIKITGAGVHDPEFLGSLTQLVGDHWVPKPTSVSRQSQGGYSESMDMVQAPIMPVSRLAAMSKSEALLITPGRPVAHGELLPWYSESDAEDITQASQAANDDVRAAAVAYLGRSNPVARALAAERGETQPQHAEPL